MPTQSSPPKLNFRQLLPILVIVLVDVMGLTIISPVLPFYALAFDASPLTIGLLISSYPLMQFFFVPILGTLSDRFGRKPVLAIAQVGTFCSLLLLGMANTLSLVFFSRIVDGITGANLATVQSAISDSTSPRDRARGLGLIGATFGLGYILGPMISGLTLRLTDNNYSAPAFVGAGFALLSVILTTFVFKETLQPENRGKTSSHRLDIGGMVEALRSPALGTLYLLTFMRQLVFGIFIAVFAPFLLTRLGLNSFGTTLFFALFGLVTVVVQGGLIGPLTQRFGERRLVFMGLALFGLGFFVSGFTPQQPVPWYSSEAIVAELSQRGEAPSEQLALLPDETQPGVTALTYALLALLPLGIGYALLSPSINSLITKRTNSHQIGRALGLGAAFMSAGTAIGPSLGGILFNSFGPAAPYLINGLVTGLLLLIAFQRLTPEPGDVATELVRSSS